MTGTLPLRRGAALLAHAAAIVLLTAGCSAREESVGTKIVDDDRDVRSDVSSSPASVCRPEWILLEPGLRHRNHCDDRAVALHLVEIDPKLWTLDAVRVEPTTAPAVARHRGARFAINANFFDPEKKTLGAIVTAGRSVQRPHPVSWQSIFYTTPEGVVGIVLPEGWGVVRETAAMAAQAGPRIVVDGRPTDATRATPSARSGVCLARDRAIFFATAAALYDVQEIAALASRSEDEGGLGCRDAMLFDGGPSAQMHLDGAGISIKGDSVPAFVLASPRAGDRR